MTNEHQDTEQAMAKCIAGFEKELSKIRAGRAHPSLIEHLLVEYYGSKVPISQVASVNAEDARTLSITPWEKDMVNAIEKTIMTSDLGLNPATAGMVIRLPIPALTEERRRSLTKVVRDTTEKARIALRQVRRDAISEYKSLLKSKEISEDECHQAEQSIQKITDDNINQLDALCKQKEADLMSV